MILNKLENPDGLHQRYFIQKIVGYKAYFPKSGIGQYDSKGMELRDIESIDDIADGTEIFPQFMDVDDNAEYFVLRLDKNGSDLKHIIAGRAAIHTYANEIESHVPTLAKELRESYPLMSPASVYGEWSSTNMQKAAETSLKDVWNAPVYGVDKRQLLESIAYIRNKLSPLSNLVALLSEEEGFRGGVKNIIEGEVINSLESLKSITNELNLLETLRPTGNEWVSVKESKPDLDEERGIAVLISKRGEREYEHTMSADWDGKKWIDSKGKDIEDNPDYFIVTHYCILPSPPNQSTK